MTKNLSRNINIDFLGQKEAALYMLLQFVAWVYFIFTQAYRKGVDFLEEFLTVEIWKNDVTRLKAFGKSK